MLTCITRQISSTGHTWRQLSTKSSSDAPTCLLAGRIFDGAGEPLLATHASKGARRYRYYVSKALQTGTLTDRSLGIRLPASEVEQLVAQELAAVLADPLDFAE